MKKLLLRAFMVIVACCFYPTFALSETISPNAGEVVVMPTNPTSTDSILMVYYYTSSDGCPDYNLALDSVVTNKVYVSRKKIDNGDRMCTMVITKFKSIINLGVLKANSLIYFDGKLVKTITPPCVMNKTGIVVAGTNECLGRLFIEDTSSSVMSPLPQLYAFENNVIVNGTSTTKLKVGDKVKFGSNSILNDNTSTCKIVGIANCFEIIQVTPPPPPPCVMDKTGIVVYGDNECATKIFIQEYSPISSAKQLYLIENNGVTNGVTNTGLKVGNKVKFGGYLIKADSTKIYGCGIVGIATCYVITETPPCVMDKVGLVFEIKNNMCLIKDSTNSADVYAIQGANLVIGTKIQFKGVKINCITTPCYNIVECFKVIQTPPACVMDKTGLVYEIKENMCLIKESNNSTDIYAIPGAKFAIGTKIQFKGVKIECITTPCYNKVECFKVIETPPTCIMDKTGVIVKGENECATRMFIQENSPISSAKQLYAFDNNVTNSSILAAKIGSKVKFGGYLIDSTKVYGCGVVGIATCYAVTETPTCIMDKSGKVIENKDNTSIIQNDSISTDLYAIPGLNLPIGSKLMFKGLKVECVTTPCYNKVECFKVLETPPCIMDKTGVVVAGIDGCTGRLFILENTSSGTSPKMYSIQAKAIRADGSSSIVLKVGDKVKFGAYTNSSDGNSILCPTAGVASCYELISLENTFTLAGTAIAGNDLMKQGLAYLFKKGDTKACASNTIQNGVFKFVNLPVGEYTVYVIPSINVYKTYLPTFYTNKFLFSEADYIDLDKNILDIVVNLNQFELPKGIGKISGTITYENNTLKDSIFATFGLEKPLMPDMNKIASYTPVSLLNDFNEAVAWAISDSLGNYTFDNIPLDYYIVASETASAKGESTAALNTNKTAVSADIILKSPVEATGLNINRDTQVSIYPNPATNKVIISLKESKDINIYNALGQLLLTQQLKEGKNILNISSLDKGVCFLKIGNSTYKLFKE